MPEGPAAPEPLDIPRMTKVAVRNVSPGVDPASPSGQPVVIYRLGNLFGRIEYGEDQYIVVREPHAFIVYPRQNKAWYAKDEGPTYVFRAPVIRGTALPDAPPEMRGLEFGHEPEFFRAYEATTRSLTRADGETVQEHTVAFGDYSMVLVTDARTAVPRQVGIFHDGGLVIAFLYDEWRRDLLPSAQVFNIPEGIEVVTGPPPGSPEAEDPAGDTPEAPAGGEAPGPDPPAETGAE
jgi:hypothetical protein